MNKTDISREKLLEATAALLLESNNADVNMRDIARVCGVSIGSVYNYFPNKEELIIAVIEDMWGRIFHPELCRLELNTGFTSTVSAMYSRIYASQKEYRNLFEAHRTLISNSGKNHGRIVMEQYLAHIKAALLKSLLSDARVNSAVWTETFSPQMLVDFTFSNLLSLLSEAESSCDYLVLVLDKLLYRQ
ncbi:MAG: TetR/AcrR family transcriptional regulator [Oscillospiraceae bacterium]